ncbi:MAG: c-type cytochrome [Comamonas sp.]|nr:c-type cytochrome [Comamonas sp.]
MKAIATAVVLAAAAVLPAHASLDLATKKACTACHQVEKKVIGPAYLDVAKKYEGMDPAELAKSIKAGGVGKWGAIPMPAQTAVSDEDVLTLATWILGGAK